MSTDIKIDEGKKKVKPKYPRLLKSRFTQELIVWGIEDTGNYDEFRAIVLSGNTAFKAGEFAQSLARSAFVDFEGTVSLTND